LSWRDDGSPTIHGRAKRRTAQTVWLCANVVSFDLTCDRVITGRSAMDRHLEGKVEIYRQRVAAKQYLKRWPKVQIIEE
jgi:hypothetical protein